MITEIHKNYLTEKIGIDGNVESCRFIVPNKFNFSYDVVDKIASEEPGRRAMHWSDDYGEKHVFSFGDIKEQSDRAAAYFQSLGINKGDCVMLILKRHYQFWFALMGLHKIGAIAVPTSCMLKTEDLTYRLGKIDIKAVISTPEDDVPLRIEEAEHNSGKSMIKILVKTTQQGWLSFDQGLAEADEFKPLPPSEWPDIHDTMLIYFTSGTESMPKMVAHDYSYPIGHIPTAKYWHNVDPNGLHLTIADTGWAKSIWGKLYGQWFMGAGVAVYDYSQFTAHALLSRLSEDRVTTFCAPSSVYRVLVRENLHKYDLSCVKHYLVAGEALNPEVIEKFSKMTGHDIYEGYGQTETTLTIAMMYWMKVKPGSMGKPSMQYRIKLLNPEGQAVPTGEIGEICIMAEHGELPGMFLGYQDEVKMNQAKWHDGVYHTGDLAWCDEDGYYWFIGRNDDVFKSSGYRISPFEIESLIMEFPGILECAVIGVPEKLRGNMIKAIIVLADGAEPTLKLKTDIKEYLKSRVSSYKVPRQIEFVKELPKTTSGKIRHSELRDR